MTVLITGVRTMVSVLMDWGPSPVSVVRATAGLSVRSLTSVSHSLVMLELLV